MKYLTKISALYNCPESGWLIILIMNFRFQILRRNKKTRSNFQGKNKKVMKQQRGCKLKYNILNLRRFVLIFYTSWSSINRRSYSIFQYVITFNFRCFLGISVQVQLQHRIKQESEKFRQWKASREKELLQVLYFYRKKKKFIWFVSVDDLMHPNSQRLVDLKRKRKMSFHCNILRNG